MNKKPLCNFFVYNRVRCLTGYNRKERQIIRKKIKKKN